MEGAETAAGTPTGQVDGVTPGAADEPPGSKKVTPPLTTPGANLGVHIANRLVEVGCSSCFAVPGDFNLLLLDQLLKHPELQMVWCCNELNAGYAADGYARKRGVGALCVTFCVGGFSALNAVAGAYAEDLPLIVISGGPKSADHASNRVLHHTTGANEYGQQMRAFREVTCCQVIIQHIEDAHMLLDRAISEALLRRKPAALDAATQWLGGAVKPVLLAGVRTRPPRARSALLSLASSAAYPVAIMPDAKGMFPEDHPQ
ncbi:hypothetical protein GPECTOR_1g318 [Gonium pectorale]|uniref:pyruvate decarboxylase n=1 Tax=Gonium pectorale TaxID=33097 RepID=A0A150H2G7_GONPE|nr:hypothetical protein GPECTOR_1g318 [Gonium pectorale]|eukprot:KXZ56359.1 hypothetical protein GPECTOR_1g318 [Gonium pectorale]